VVIGEMQAPTCVTQFETILTIITFILWLPRWTHET